MTTLHLRGIDVSDQLYWSWEWDAEGGPRFAVLERATVTPMLAELASAVPGGSEAPSADESRFPPHVSARLATARLSGDVVAEHALSMVGRILSGPLADPLIELDFSSRLGAAVLPDRLLDELRVAALRASERLVVRILPPLSCAAVPWELLPTRNGADPQERLLDLADIVTTAPLLARDGEPLQRPDGPGAGAVYIIDPEAPGTGAVLSATQQAGWRRLLEGRPAPVLASIREPVTRDWLSARLAGQAVDRLMYVGHAKSGVAGGGGDALVLADRRSTFGHGPSSAGGRRRDLTATDLLLGTRGRADRLARLASERGVTVAEVERAEFGRVTTYPARAVDADGSPREVSGRELWPMPPRVALIACQSGGDFGHLEPFGLVTAILELGAELVTATRWPLLTDAAFADGATPLNDLAHEIDRRHDGADPLRGIPAWQRGMLDRWRRSGDPVAAPVMWAAITTFHAPDRAIL